MAVVAPVAPKSQEFTLSFKFVGADTGLYPNPEGDGTTITLKGNSVQFRGGEETADFKAGMDLTAIHRIIASDPSLSVNINLLAPSAFLAAYQSAGPVCKVTVTADNQLDGAGANEQLVFYGIMVRPDIDFLSNPGKIDVEIRSYGKEPELFHTGLV